MKELCLQQRIGSCAGCPIQELAINKARTVLATDQPAVILRINEQYCPNGLKIQMPKRQKQSIW